VTTQRRLAQQPPEGLGESFAVQFDSDVTAAQCMPILPLLHPVGSESNRYMSMIWGTSLKNLLNEPLSPRSTGISARLKVPPRTHSHQLRSNMSWWVSLPSLIGKATNRTNFTLLREGILDIEATRDGWKAPSILSHSAPAGASGSEIASSSPLIYNTHQTSKSEVRIMTLTGMSG
jgi:hypothetical protein